MSLLFTPHLAYIGPGAGFSFLGSFLTLLGGLLPGLISVLLWPFRMAWGALTGRQGYKHAKIRKLIFLGLDGLDPSLAERYMAEGKLPNLTSLREMGSFQPPPPALPPSLPVSRDPLSPGRHPPPPQHVRFPQSQFALLSAGALFVARPRTGARPQHRQIPHSAEPPGGRNAPQKPHLLADPGPAPDRLHHPASAHHLPA